MDTQDEKMKNVTSITLSMEGGERKVSFLCVIEVVTSLK